MAERFINPSAGRPEVFLNSMPWWELNINGYQVVMIFWNIFLAILAIAAARWFAKRIVEPRDNPLLLIAGGIAWLLLMPNAAYIMTDARHIIGYCPPDAYGHVCAENAWMSVFFFGYALIGWVSFILTVRPVHDAFAKHSKRLGRWFISLLMPLTALGVLIGLVNRWNSWEILTDPLGIMRTIATYFYDLTYLSNWLIMTILLSLLYFCGYRLLKSQQGA